MDNKTILKIALIFGLINIAGCNSDKSSELSDKNSINEVVKIEAEQGVGPIKTAESALDNEISTAIQRALANDDYRLLHSKGRRIVVPGFEQIELSLLESQCGIKPMANSSDVMKSVEQKIQRKTQYAFAKQFNQVMHAKCLAKLEK
jgi:hypothetical protein